MKTIKWLVGLIAVALIVTPASADFYVIGGGGGVGTRITSLPYSINSPGFYYLDRNLTSTWNGIIVGSSDVTIDLMGFKITGPSGGGNYGILIGGDSQEITNVEIRNGTITKFLDGIHAIAGKHFRMINVRAIGNFMYGITLGGSGHMVKGCTLSNNTDRGLKCSSSLVIHNVAMDNPINMEVLGGSLFENWAP